MKTNESTKHVIQKARSIHFDCGHSRQVAGLSLQLFDQLAPLHKLDTSARTELEHAALLHDIGWVNGQKGHHKTAMRLILEDTDLDYSDKVRTRIALIVRYHRKSLPKEKHPVYRNLTESEKRRICILGGILRLADGLDRSHTDAVSAVTCRISKSEILILCHGTDYPHAELIAGTKKADLLTPALGRKISIEGQVHQPA